MGFALAGLIRWQLAFPGRPVPWIGGLLGASRVASGILLPDFYDQLVAMHGTIMVFLGIVPFAVGAFGSWLVPKRLGVAPSIPRIQWLGYGLFLGAGLLMLGSFWAPGGAAQAGWTAYPPLAEIVPAGQTLWLFGMLLLGGSNLCLAIGLIATGVEGKRRLGVAWTDLPFVVHSQLGAAVLLLLAFPALAAAAVLQLMDRLFGASFFRPSVDLAASGDPLLWQHLFWFLAHPEVYVLVLPAFGLVAEVLTHHAERPLWGARAAARATLALCALSLVVWAHHMFLTGMAASLSTFFQLTTVLISMPSVVVITCLLMTVGRGTLPTTTAFRFAVAFLPAFAIGGLTGLPLALAATDLPLHDTAYVVGHFHLLVAPGALFGLFAGVYHFYPQWTERRLSETLGHLHFWPSLVALFGLFVPMLIQGLGGLPRRLYDGGASYDFAKSLLPWHLVMTISAMVLAMAQVPFLINLALSRGGKPLANDEDAMSALRHPPSDPHALARLGRRLALLADFLFVASLVSVYVALGTPNLGVVRTGAQPATGLGAAFGWLFLGLAALHVLGFALALGVRAVRGGGR